MSAPASRVPRSVSEPFARLDRRSFLRLAGLAAASSVLPAGCNGVPTALQPPANVALQILSPRAYASLTGFAMRCIGPHGAAAIGARRIDPAREVDAFVTRVPALQGPLLQALWVLEWGVPPIAAKWRPFTTLDGAAQDRVLDDWMRSRFELKRDLFKGVKSLVMLAFYSDPASNELVGYPGPFDAAGITAAMADLAVATPGDS